MMPLRHVVIVEDDAPIAELIQYNLSGEGYTVSAFGSGRELMDRLSRLEDICLFILDIMLPEMDGFEICARLRAIKDFSMTPVIMLTARGSESDKVKGLNVGADDYITKPFGIREFLARVAAQVRRYEVAMAAASESKTECANDSSDNRNLDVSTPDVSGVRRSDSAFLMPDPSGDGEVLRAGSISLDDIRHRVYLEGEEIEMTNREYELLKFLMSHRGVAFSRDDLLNRVWGYDYVGETRTVDVHVRQLRKKLLNDDARDDYIETVRGRGYRFRE